jgi:hypothetical protein
MSIILCRECGTDMLKECKNTNGKIIISKKRTIHKEILNEKECFKKPEVCITCIEAKYGKIKRSLSKETYKWVYNLSKQEVDKIWGNRAITKNNLVKKYGKEEGIKRWEKYIEKQRLSNTYEYKKEKYGMTNEEFSSYNKNRATTEENFILRYGEKEGKEKWAQYIERQRYAGCQLEYFKEKYGKKKAS